MAKARSFLKKVGLSKDYIFEILLCDSTPKIKEIANLYKNQFEKIGLKVQISMHDYVKFYKLKRDGRYSFLQVNTIPSYADPDAMLFPYFYSKSDSNVAHIKDKMLDNMILQARREHDLEKRMVLNTKINNYLLERAYVIPVYSENITLYAHKHLKIPPISGLGVWFVEYKYINWIGEDIKKVSSVY